MITQADAEKAVDWLRDNASRMAQQRAERLYMVERMIVRHEDESRILAQYFDMDYDVSIRLHDATAAMLRALRSENAALKADGKAVFDLSVECRARAVKAEAERDALRSDLDSCRSALRAERDLQHAAADMIAKERDAFQAALAAARERVRELEADDALMALKRNNDDLREWVAALEARVNEALAGYRDLPPVQEGLKVE